MHIERLLGTKYQAKLFKDKTSTQDLISATKEKSESSKMEADMYK